MISIGKGPESIYHGKHVADTRQRIYVGQSVGQLQD